MRLSVEDACDFAMTLERANPHDVVELPRGMTLNQAARIDEVVRLQLELKRVEAALDRVDAPMLHDNGEWMSPSDRILALVGMEIVGGQS